MAVTLAITPLRLRRLATLRLRLLPVTLLLLVALRLGLLPVTLLLRVALRLGLLSVTLLLRVALLLGRRSALCRPVLRGPALREAVIAVLERTLLARTGIAHVRILPLIARQRCPRRHRAPIPAVPARPAALPARAPVLTPARRPVAIPVVEE